MLNKQRGVFTKQKGKEIIIDSEQYEKDKAYSESIDKQLKQLFKKDIEPN